MKKWQIKIIVIVLLFTVWIWMGSYLDLLYWLAWPVVVVAAVGAYAAYDIFGSIMRIKSKPEDRASLDVDILRAREYYKTESVILD